MSVPHPGTDALARGAGAELELATGFLRGFSQGTVRQWSKRAGQAPLGALHAAAVHHPDPFVRRSCLGFLDHYANDASAEVFAVALRDPVEFVRNAALHSIACETCKSEELCVDDVVPRVIAVLEEDRSPDLRTKAVAVLLRLSARDPRAVVALEHAATHDADPLLRRAATDALAGRFIPPRKRYERRQRRHDRAVTQPEGP